jgi:hypothetical protein
LIPKKPCLDEEIHRIVEKAFKMKEKNWILMTDSQVWRMLQGLKPEQPKLTEQVANVIKTLSTVNNIYL